MFQFYIAIVLISAFLYFVNRNRMSRGVNYLGILLFIIAPKEIFTHSLYLEKQNTDIYNHIFQIIEFTLMSFAYLFTYNANRNKNIARLFMWCYLQFSLCLLAYVESHPNIKLTINYNLLIEMFLLVIYSLLYIYELFEYPIVEKIWKLPFFWINFGILSYNAVSFVQLAFNGPLRDINTILADQASLISHILNYFLYLCFAIGFLCKNQQAS